jgi:hypothetical protein
MLGRFLAGTTESPGDIIMKDGKRVKVPKASFYVSLFPCD